MKGSSFGASRTLVCLVCLFLLEASLPAQVITGTFVGQIRDNTGAVIAGAKVAATNVDTGFRQEAMTSNVGTYSIPALPNGTYMVEASATGFKTLKKGPIVLNSNQQLAVDLVLPAGGVGESIEVKGDAERIQTQESTVKAQVYLDQVRNLPLNSRSPFELGLLGPSIQTNRQQSGPAVQYTINGQNVNGYKLMFDGNEAGIGGDAQYWAGNNFNLSITSVDAIQEFDIATGNYSADIKGSSGYVNIVSKSGTNKLHADVYDFFRNGALDARNYFQAKKGSLKQNDFGGTITGPIVKNKVFFMASYEGQRIHLPFAGFANVPTAAFRATIDPRLQHFVSLTPLPTEAIPGNPNVGIFRANVASIANQNLVTGRVDWNFSDKDRVFVQYTFNDGQLHGGTPTTGNGPSIFPGIGNSQPERHQFATVGWSHTFSPTLLNDFKIGLNRFLQGRVIGPTDPTDFLLPGATVPGLVLASGGNAKKLGNTQPQISDKATWVRGRSTLSFGGNFIYLMSGQAQRSFINMGFPSLAAFAADTPSTLNSTFGTAGTELPEHLHWHQIGLFVQEDFRATPTLTLNIGLRYDNFGVFVDSARNARNVINGPFDPFRAPDEPLYDSNHDFGPRLGFAWRPSTTRPFVLRGGFGLFYGTHVSGQMGDVLVLNAVHPFALTTADFPNLSYPFSPALLHNADTTVGRFVLDPHTPDFYTEQWNLTAEYELGGNVISLGYVGNNGIHVPGTLLPNNVDPLLGHRPNTNFGAVREVTNADTMHYNALQASVRRRLTHNLAFDAAYAWSHATGLETGSLEVSAAVSFSADQIQAYKVKNQSRGTLPIDITHNFSTDFVYQLPRLNGANAFAKAVLGGWTTSGIFKASTGLPFNITTGGDTGDLTFNQRPNRVAGVPLYISGNNAAQGFVNPAAFVKPTVVDPTTGLVLGSFGNNILRLPASYAFDWSFSKRVYGSDSFFVDFRSEFFNILNHPIFGFPTSSLAAGSLFGKSTSASDGRQIQFMLKLGF